MIHTNDRRQVEQMLESMSDRKFYATVNELIANPGVDLPISPIYQMREFDNVMHEHSPLSIASLVSNSNGRFTPSDKYFVIDYQYGQQLLSSFNNVDDPGYPIGSDLFDQIIDAIVAAQ